MSCSVKQASAELCTAHAGVGRRICTEPVHPDGLTALVAYRLIMAKAVMSTVKDDVLKAARPLQVCAAPDTRHEKDLCEHRHSRRTPSR